MMCVRALPEYAQKFLTFCNEEPLKLHPFFKAGPLDTKPILQADRKKKEKKKSFWYLLPKNHETLFRVNIGQ
jgi:hypothetical protein